MPLDRTRKVFHYWELYSVNARAFRRMWDGRLSPYFETTETSYLDQIVISYGSDCRNWDSVLRSCHSTQQGKILFRRFTYVVPNRMAVANQIQLSLPEDRRYLKAVTYGVINGLLRPTAGVFNPSENPNPCLAIDYRTNIIDKNAIYSTYTDSTTGRSCRVPSRCLFPNTSNYRPRRGQNQDEAVASEILWTSARIRENFADRECPQEVSIVRRDYLAEGWICLNNYSFRYVLKPDAEKNNNHFTTRYYLPISFTVRNETMNETEEPLDNEEEHDEEEEQEPELHEWECCSCGATDETEEDELPDGWSLDHRSIYCDNCIHTCTDCATTLYGDIEYSTDNGPLCESCYDNYGGCVACDEIVHMDDLMRCADGNYVCDSCYSNNYATCDHCDLIYHNDDLHDDEHDEDSDIIICTNCNRIRMESAPRSDGFHSAVRYIRSYSYKPEPLFFLNDGIMVSNDYMTTKEERGSMSDTQVLALAKERIKKRYFGVELETAINSGNIQEYAYKVLKTVECQDMTGAGERKNFIYLKYDSSIGSGDSNVTGGFEIVSHPSEFEECKRRWTKIIEGKPQGLISHDTNSCGLHVHVSKESLTKLQIGKIVQMVNDPKHHKFMVALARRNSENYGRFKAEKKLIDVQIGRGNDRYEAVNIGNRHTIEFRLFKGTWHKTSFLTCLEFCDAICSFCAPGNVGVNDLNLKEFQAFVKKFRKFWPNLLNFCTQFYEGKKVDDKPKTGNNTSATMRF